MGPVDNDSRFYLDTQPGAPEVTLLHRGMALPLPGITGLVEWGARFNRSRTALQQLLRCSRAENFSRQRNTPGAMVRGSDMFNWPEGVTI